MLIHYIPKVERFLRIFLDFKKVRKMSSKEGYSTLEFCMLKFQPSPTIETLLTSVSPTPLNLFFLKLFPEQ